jgi:hypothetical protein
LKVADTPAAAPHATITRSWLAGTFSICPIDEPSLDGDDPLTDDAPAQSHGRHHFRYAVPLGLAREEVDQRADDGAARCGNQQSPIPRQRTRDLERVARVCEQALIDHIHHAFGATEECGLAEADHQSKEDRAARTRESTGDRDQNHE